MINKILLFVIPVFFIILVAGYLAITNNLYSDIATSIIGCVIGALIILAAKAIIFRRKISPYDVSVITIITVLLSFSVAISGLLLSDSAPLIKALATSAILMTGGLIALKFFQRNKKNTESGNE
ncbi:hypothetical protein NAL19_1252 [Pectobacterium sp. F1-1]|uniref:hypothetical protein n=1 Tax=Pectobacterium sp. F1-1 TaxID=2949614 RepID=UPI0021D796F2|nr:hypothetical protein [Pectobacterium sp. F1-1]UYA59460.1 hypothetical protein NAL19_1252 [Pectobacterium sp. F1-1]